MLFVGKLGFRGIASHLPLPGAWIFSRTLLFFMDGSGGAEAGPNEAAEALQGLRNSAPSLTGAQEAGTCRSPVPRGQQTPVGAAGPASRVLTARQLSVRTICLGTKALRGLSE